MVPTILIGSWTYLPFLQIWLKLISGLKQCLWVQMGYLDGMSWGWGMRGRNLDCKPRFLTKPDWKWAITFRF